jgi:hypothetical protein
MVAYASYDPYDPVITPAYRRSETPVLPGRIAPASELSGSRCSAHLGIEIALGAAELWCPDIACSAQCEQRHPDTARLYHDHALAPAEGEPSETGDSGLGHCRADHPERLDRDRTIGMENVG